VCPRAGISLTQRRLRTQSSHLHDNQEELGIVAGWIPFGGCGPSTIQWDKPSSHWPPRGEWGSLSSWRWHDPSTFTAFVITCSASSSRRLLMQNCQHLDWWGRRARTAPRLINQSLNIVAISASCLAWLRLGTGFTERNVARRFRGTSMWTWTVEKRALLIRLKTISKVTLTGTDGSLQLCQMCNSRLSSAMDVTDLYHDGHSNENVKNYGNGVFLRNRQIHGVFMVIPSSENITKTSVESVVVPGAGYSAYLWWN